MKIETPKSKISVIKTHGDANYKHSLCFICHTNDVVSLQKTIDYILNKISKESKQ